MELYTKRFKYNQETKKTYTWIKEDAELFLKLASQNLGGDRRFVVLETTT